MPSKFILSFLIKLGYTELLPLLLPELLSWAKVSADITAHLKHQLTCQVPVCGCCRPVPVEIYEELSWQQCQGASTANSITSYITKDVALCKDPVYWGSLLEPKFG